MNILILLLSGITIALIVTEIATEEGFLGIYLGGVMIWLMDMEQFDEPDSGKRQPLPPGKDRQVVPVKNRSGRKRR